MNFFQGKQGLFFGDSIIQGNGVLPKNAGYATPTEDVVSQLEKMLECSIVNGAIGGTRLSDGNSSFLKMVDSLFSGDYSEQQAFAEQLEKEYPAFGFLGLLTQYERIKALNPEKIDFICISYGCNDWTAGALLDNDEDPFDSKTVCGALRLGLQKLMTALPQAEIYVFTPSYRKFKDSDSDHYVIKASGLTLREVALGIEKVCLEFHVPCANMYDRSNTNRYNFDYYSPDGSHRNAIGYEMMARQFAKFMLSGGF